MGYKLGQIRSQQARLREQKRVLSIEAASFESPQRVEMVARSLLGMTDPPPERIFLVRGKSYFSESFTSTHSSDGTDQEQDSSKPVLGQPLGVNP